VQLIFALLKPSVALTKTATSLTPCSRAMPSPLTFGTRTGRRSGGFLASKPLATGLWSTWRQSASCGIARGETTDVTSMVCSKACSSRWINSSFVAVGIGSRMFWSPSLGPTSTIRTACEGPDILGVSVQNCSGMSPRGHEIRDPRSLLDRLRFLGPKSVALAGGSAVGPIYNLGPLTRRRQLTYGDLN
jgi:hypothetical protein